MGIWDISSRVKLPGREADHPPPTSEEIKIMLIYAPTYHIP
jgi:hypothetical protein